MQLSASEAFQTLLALADMIFSPFSEVEFAPIVDKSDGIDRAESLARFERRTAAQFEMKSGNSTLE